MRRLLPLLALLSFAAAVGQRVTLDEAVAGGCGAPAGPAGKDPTADGVPARPWHVSLTAGYFDAALRFDDRFDADVREVLISAGLARDVGDFTIGIQLGAILDGELHTAGAGGADYAITPGFLVGLAGEWHALRAPRAPITLSLGLQLAVASARVKDAFGDTAPWVALDARLSLTVSRTFWEVLTPYAAVRALGGPILWSNRSANSPEVGGAKDVVGSDPRHVQLALGLGVAPHPAFALHLEWDYFGEHGLFGGVSASF